MIAALLSFAGGVIHLAVIRHHLDAAPVAGGLALMGTAQWLFAARIATRPSRPVRGAGVLLHATIIVIWLLSRTIGLVVVPGAEDPAPVGVPDLVANLFALATIVTAIAMRHSSYDLRPSSRPRVGTRLAAAVAVAVFALTVPAVLSDHDHAGHDHPVTGGPASEQDGGPADGDRHDDQGHEHG